MKLFNNSIFATFLLLCGREPGAMLQCFSVDALTGVVLGVGFLTSSLSELRCLSDRVDESMVQSCFKSQVQSTKCSGGLWPHTNNPAGLLLSNKTR